MIFRRDPLADPGPLVRRVYAYVAYRVGPGPDAEDLTSDVFERALRFRESYDPGRGSPEAWLIGIARRSLTDWFARRPEREADMPDTPAPGSLDEDATNRLAVADGLRRLGGRDAELLALRYGADLTARQIGTLLEMRTNAVEVALHRALNRLRLVLDDKPLAAVRVSHARPVSEGE